MILNGSISKWKVNYCMIKIFKLSNQKMIFNSCTLKLKYKTYNSISLSIIKNIRGRIALFVLDLPVLPFLSSIIKFGGGLHYPSVNLPIMTLHVVMYCVIILNIQSQRWFIIFVTQCEIISTRSFFFCKFLRDDILLHKKKFKWWLYRPS